MDELFLDTIATPLDFNPATECTGVVARSHLALTTAIDGGGDSIEFLDAFSRTYEIAMESLLVGW